MSIETNKKLEERTLMFAVAVVKFVSSFPPSEAAKIISRQLVKAGTSVGANYREANRAESREDFIHKSAVTLKESAETDYWLDLCTRVNLGEPQQRDALTQEARELLAIFTTINRNAKRR